MALPAKVSHACLRTKAAPFPPEDGLQTCRSLLPLTRGDGFGIFGLLVWHVLILGRCTDLQACQRLSSLLTESLYDLLMTVVLCADRSRCSHTDSETIVEDDKVVWLARCSCAPLYSFFRKRSAPGVVVFDVVVRRASADRNSHSTL